MKKTTKKKNNYQLNTRYGENIKKLTREFSRREIKEWLREDKL